MADEPLIAVFVDFENLAIGVRDMNKGPFQIELVLRRLLEKGRIVFKRAYCDWKNYRDAVPELHRHGIEMVDIPGSKASGKNSADIRMVTDAIDLCYSKNHIDTFALLSGDSDFSPLASKLKENNKRVIGCGVKNSTSDLLMESCDEFILYDDLVRAARKAQQPRRAQHRAEPKKQEAFDRVIEIVGSLALDHDVVWGSMVKQAIKRVYPGFNENYHGYSSFTKLLEDMKKEGLLELREERPGNYSVRLVSEGS
ncbi:MAG TPA: NYN domain-containing protein [Planctomycetota bacterium]|nr:NYN domain-containing protein [Planctomycetota bacterium]HRR80415.1 NYN domain-containing protein [Planctomycetota bacterium]HRT96045.1 NYN domain-containing protein [Planctomycetota bacterium]